MFRCILFFTGLVVAMAMDPQVGFLRASGGANQDMNACLVLTKYEDQFCNGEAAPSNSVNTFSEPGSPCSAFNTTDPVPKMDSAKDIYCDATGVFHETLYVDNAYCCEKCASQVIHGVLFPGKCYGGMMIECQPHPCASKTEELPENVDVAALFRM